MLIGNKDRRKFIIRSIIILGVFVTSLKGKNNKFLVGKYTKKTNNWMLHLNDY